MVADLLSASAPVKPPVPTWELVAVPVLLASSWPWAAPPTTALVPAPNRAAPNAAATAFRMFILFPSPSCSVSRSTGEERTPPGEDEGGPFPGRPAGAAASKAELKASVLLAVRRLPTAKPWSAPADPFGPHLSQKAPPRCGQRGQRPRVVTYLMRNDWEPLLALPWLEALALPECTLLCTSWLMRPWP